MGFIQDKIYPKLPVFIQNIAISIFGYYWHKRRFGGVFQQELAKFKSREFFNESEWNHYVEVELQKILTHAYLNVPYYKAKFDEIGLTDIELSAFKLKNLPRLPILSKNELRLYGQSDLMSRLYNKKGAFFSSSGSTGTPTKIYVSQKMHQIWSAAFEVRIRNWAGLKINNPRGMIGGRKIVPGGNDSAPFFRYNFSEKQVYFSAYHISSKNIRNYLHGMKKYKIDYMTGYALSNFTLARFLKENNLSAPKLKAVITSSEKLTKEMRDIFLDVYGCKSFDSYSGVEGCGLISECEFGKLHISPDIGIIEIIKGNGEHAGPGEIGEAICTGLLNFDQPLIRYQIGDFLKLSKNQNCDCGRKMTIIEEIVGRVEDTVIGLDGREMVRFHGIFVDMSKIIEGQIIQHTLNEFEIVLVSSEKLNEMDKDLLLKRMQSQLGQISLTITETDQIPRNQNGKFKSVISFVNRNK
jgi:phenylacetate-CoA ligase